MTLAASVAAQTHQPCVVVKYGGTTIPNVLSVEREHSFDQQSQTCTITVGQFFPFYPDSISLVQVYEGYDNQTVISFSGYVDDVKKGCYPATWQIVCRDVLKKAQDIWLDDVGVTYNSTQAETAVADLLSRAGLSVTAGTTGFTIADIQPASFKLVSLMDAVNQIAALIGWRCWAGPDGTVYFQYSKPKPSATSTWTYTKGVDILDYQYEFTDRNTRNRIVCVGYGSIRSAVNSSSPYVQSGYYRTAILSSELIDTQGMADTFAAWMLADLNVATESLRTFKVVGNPLIGVGNTIHVTDTQRGINANFFIFDLRSRVDGQTGEYTQEMTLVRQEGTTTVNYEPPLPGDGPVPGTDTPPADIPVDDPSTLTPGKGNLLYVSTLKGLAKCTGAWGTDGTDGDPVWTACNSGLAGAALKIRWFNLDMWSRQGDHFTAGWAMTDAGLYRVTGLPDAGVWTQQLSPAAAAALISGATGYNALPYVLSRMFTPSTRLAGFVACLAFMEYTPTHFYPWNERRSFWLYSLDSGATWQVDLTKFVADQVNDNNYDSFWIVPSFHLDNAYYQTGGYGGKRALQSDPNGWTARDPIFKGTGAPPAFARWLIDSAQQGDGARVYFPWCDASGNVYADDQVGYIFQMNSQGTGTGALRRYAGLPTDSYSNIGHADMTMLRWYFTNMWNENYGIALDSQNLWFTANQGSAWTRKLSPTVGARQLSPVYEFCVPADPQIAFFCGGVALGSGNGIVCFTPDFGSTFVDISLPGEAGGLDTVMGLTSAADMGDSIMLVDYHKV